MTNTTLQQHIINTLQNNINFQTTRLNEYKRKLDLATDFDIIEELESAITHLTSNLSYSKSRLKELTSMYL